MLCYKHKIIVRKKTPMNVAMESNLISQIRDNKDSVALDKLVRRYQPMIDNMASQYFVNGFDRDDWYQEAFLVCYQTCKLFDGSTGSKFGSFYKMKFKHHIIDLIRHENAVKRKINSLVEPLEIGDQNRLTAPSHKKVVELQDHIEQAIRRLKGIDVYAMQAIFGMISIDEGCKRAKCNRRQFQRSLYRCRMLIMRFRYDDLS